MAEAIAIALKRYREFDSRLIVLFLLVTYNVLGITVLGFNRSYDQIIITAISAVLLQILYDLVFKGRVVSALSALITSMGLCILLNYGHSVFYPLVPVYFAISSKYFFTFKGRHTFNPALMGVVLSLVLTNEFISPAPAYQWNGIGAFSVFIAMPAILFFMPKINRTPLVLSFLGVFTLQIILRSILIKHYLPFNTLFFGTITSPPFFLFTFFMITDPVTSPNDKKEQIIAGVSIALLDLFYHLFQSYHTFFFAGVTFGGYRFLKGHWRASKDEDNFLIYIKKNFFISGHYKKILLVLAIGLSGFSIHKFVLQDKFSTKSIDFKLNLIPSQQSGLSFVQGEIFDQVDPRVQHMGKWILGITDGIAVGDINGDGLQDLFLTNGHKSQQDRGEFFINLGDFKFEKKSIPNVKKNFLDFKKYGVASNAMFVDFDNDGDLDLFVTHAFGEEGTSRLYQNKFKEMGILDFEDVTDQLNLREFTNAAAANWFDMDKDGKLDLIIGNTIATQLPNYETATNLNLFNLPKEQFEGDRRMYDFMHESWHMANNGAVNPLFINRGNSFEKLDVSKIGMPETRWTMAIGTADFNRDGFTDLYMANDFGADDLYLSVEGKEFKNIKGDNFGSIGKDTYKGMNATVADFDENGWLDMYVSNVHHALQAEGSLLWEFESNPKDQFVPKIKEQATFSGVLNEDRFGWGAGVADFNNDSFVDLVQANGMVDDLYDRKFESCPDYWYINEKIARSPPSIHRFIDNWGDVRGTCIHGQEKNRFYLNRGADKRPQFVDIANDVGMNQIGNWRGMAVVDLNNDGVMDLISTSLYRNPLVFKNELSAKNHDWIGFELESLSPSCNREGIGSRIELKFIDRKGKERVLVQEKVVVNGFSAQSDRRIHFGLGENAKLIGLTIDWCLKQKIYYNNLTKNSYQKLQLTGQ